MIADGGALPSVWSWALLIIPFSIGIASGGQSIYSKLGGEWLRVLYTIAGWLYWLSRGVVPAVCYYLVAAAHPDLPYPGSTAVLCGLSSEAVLRSQFFIGSKKINGKTQDIYKGIFDLVEWYQNLLLRLSSNSLAAGRLKFVKSIVGMTTDFPALCAKAKSNAASFQVAGDELRDIIDKTLTAFQKEPTVRNGTASPDLHRNYACELAYGLLQAVGRKSLRTLFA